MSQFLTDEELRQLTGRTWRCRQIDHLNKAGIPYTLDAIGRPVVSRAYFNGTPETAAPSKEWEPSLA